MAGVFKKIATIEMAEPRRSDRKRNQTDFLGAGETLGRSGRTKESELSACRAHEAAVANAYERLAGLKQLGEAWGGEGSVWVGADDSPALGGFAPPPDDRQRFLQPICSKLFNLGRGVQGNSHATTTAAATEARRDQAVQEVYERFETACDDLDSGLFDLDLDRHCYCCMQFFAGARDYHSRTEGGLVWCRACSYQVHGWRGNGGQHREFATTARPNDRCPAGCPGCTA